MQVESDKLKFRGYLSRIDEFLDRSIGFENSFDPDVFVPGRLTLRFYEESLPHTFAQISGDAFETIGGEPGNYERELAERLWESDDINLLITIGALGSGKSTATHKIMNYLSDKHAAALVEQPSRCWCERCPTGPLYVSCKDLRNATYSAAEVFARIWSIVLDRLLDCWLAPAELSRSAMSDDLQRTLRFIVGIRSIGSWAKLQTIHAFPRPSAPLKIVGAIPNLLAICCTKDEVERVNREFTPQVDDLEAYFYEFVHEDHEAEQFTSCALGYLLSKQSSATVPVILIVDNLDQLPTTKITHLLNAINSCAIQNRRLRILVPLRPTSIALEGYTGNVVHTYHHGPCCFDLVHRRLSKFILGRSRADLESVKSPDSRMQLFKTHPSPDEVVALLVVAYVYDSIMKAGMSTSGSGALGAFDGVHEDHKITLSRMQLNQKSLEAFAQTLRALVGLSGRYAIAHLSQFFFDMYSHPDTLSVATSRIRNGDKASISYRRLVETLLFDRSGKLTLGRCVNLFLPVRRSNDSRLPSLIKLRILLFLRVRPRVRVLEVLEHLATFGIPSTIALECLNQLHDESRRLVWFSDNHRIEVTSGLVQDVVISEHGQGYLEHLVVEFDYVWACSVILDQSNAHRFSASDKVGNFENRLSAYVRLLQDIADTDWKQCVFHIGRRGEPIPSDIGKSGESMISLELLYSTVVKAASSSRSAVSSSAHRDHDGDEYVVGIVDLIIQVCDILRLSEERYQRLFGDCGYLETYRRQIDAARHAILSLESAEGLTREQRAKLAASRSRWTENDSGRGQVISAGIQSEDAVTRFAAIGRGLIPVAHQQALNAVASRTMYVEHYFITLARVRELLDRRMLRHQEIIRCLEELALEADGIVKTFDATGLAVGSSTAAKMLADRDEFRRQKGEFEANGYDADVGVVDEQTMDKLKKKFNKTLSLMARFALTFEHATQEASTDVLSARWA